jgi:translation initiation factor IF-1
MVKNITGGNKSKKQARGSGAAVSQNKNVRKAIEDGEIYAVVTKINGGNNCQIMCNDGIARCCFIRNKFKSFGKRENTISVGIWILAGVRLWESRASGVQKCDLLEVYSDTEKDYLKQNETCSFNHLLNAIEADRSSKSIGGVMFSNTIDNDNDNNDNGMKEEKFIDKEINDTDDILLMEEQEQEEEKVISSRKKINNNNNNNNNNKSLKDILNPKNHTSSSSNNNNNNNNNLDSNNWLKDDTINVDDI